MKYQLPAEAPHFVNREAELRCARSAVAEWREPGRPLCIALSGLGGAGKTELAYRIARAVRERYPDHILHVDLDEWRRDGAVEVHDVLGVLLGGLEVEPEWHERSFTARCRQYWDRTNDRRLIVIIDNARYAAEVRPLLPSSGSSLMIVASHGPMYELEEGAAYELPLAPLSDEHAELLLRKVTDDPRLAQEPAAVQELLRLCSGLPAALHVAGRWLRRYRRRTLSRLLDELTTEVREQGLPMVERVWDAAYASLGPQAARLYRLLASCPATGVLPEAGVALLGSDVDSADRAREELENAGLLDPRHERLRLSELLRAHAARRATADPVGRGTDVPTPQEAPEAALGRLVEWYARQAQRADLAAAGPRLVVAPQVPALPEAPDVSFPDSAGGMRWLEEERQVLYDLLRRAPAWGLEGPTVALCEPLWTHYLDHPHPHEAIAAFRTGVEAAGRLSATPALIRMRCQLARALWEDGQFAEAGAEVDRALHAMPLLGRSELERKLAASVVETRGRLRAECGDWREAAEDYADCRERHVAIGNAYGVLLQDYQLGQALAACGETERAEGLLEEAHAAATEQGRARMTARTALALAGVSRRNGNPSRARSLCQTALAGARERGSGVEEARTLEELALVAEMVGDPGTASEHRAAARELRVRQGALVTGGVGSGGPGDAGGADAGGTDAGAGRTAAGGGARVTTSEPPPLPSP